jgi:hemerythrin-like domain-containing protein
MATISEVLGQDHQVIDEALLAARAATTAGDLAAAQQHADLFTDILLRHIEAEEQILFPAFEKATGMESGPTEVMRSEHEQMRYQIQELKAALAAGETEEARQTVGLLVSLLELHNPKEERMLYPMCDRALLARSPEVLQQVQAKISEAAR